MFPTSSSTLLVGRNARSATARITLLPVLPLWLCRGRGPSVVSLRHTAVKDQVRTVIERARAWYVPIALSGWRICGIPGALAVALTLTACGGGQLQSANEPNGKFKVSVTSSFPATQRLSEATKFIVKVTNVDTHAIPDVAVTICNVTCGASSKDLQRGWGTSVQAFSYKLDMPGLASDSRPVWVVDQAPNPNGCQYSCQQGGPGGAVTAYSNTWALGRLAPGKSATFDWHVTAIRPGNYTVAWQVAAGLNGKALARTSSGGVPQGTFKVKIANAPQQSYVDNSGQVVNTQ
jgi:hypothetical protein